MSVQIPILYGTETGNAQDCAEELADALVDVGWTSEAIDLDDFEAEDIADLPLVLIVSSTHGNGDPPENAEHLMEFLKEDSPDLSKVHFAVCALGDSAYRYFCQCGKDFDMYLEKCGATRVLPRVDCDFSFDVPFAQFKDSVLNYLNAERSTVLGILGGEKPVYTETVETVEKEEPKAFNRDNPFMGTLTTRRKLSKEGSAKETMHYEISLEGSGIQYQTGDCIGVYPVNNVVEVNEILKAAGFSGGETVTWKNEQYLLSDLLLNKVCLQRVSVDLMNLLGETSKKIKRVIQDGHEAMTEFMEQNHVLDALVAASEKSWFKTKTVRSAQAFADSLKRMQPRLYSIASCQKSVGNEVHFTIETVRYEQNGRSVEGVASTWFADRLDANDTGKIPLYLHPNANFKLPSDNAPVILIGPGTGIAPFRAFLQEKAVGDFTGDVWLLFGHQHEAFDYLYGEEFESYLQNGQLQHLDLAWSRDQDSKVYVQHKLLEHKERFWEWISNGASVYVCGDALRMAKDVDATIQEIGQQFGDTDLIATLEKSGRYQKDVY